MKLSYIIENINNTQVINFNDIDVNGVCYNTKEVKQGDLFICIKGFVVDAHDFAKDAVKAGAVAIMCEKQLDVDVPQIVVDNTRHYMADLAALFYGNPAKELNTVGVTGTNGKTTITHLLQEILEKNNQKSALIGTLGHKLCCDDVYKDEDRTTPQSLELQKLFREFVDNHAVENVFMEVSSHALEQNRVGNCDFNGAIFTNLTQDHLDYHLTMDGYFDAKAILFKNIKEGGFAVINADDEYGERFLSVVSDGVKKITYGINNKADFMAFDIKFSQSGVSFECKTPNAQKRVSLKMNGLFSVYNVLATMAAACAMNVDFEKVVDVLESIDGVSGRFEVVVNKPMVIVDYAHTPDGLENVLKTARDITPKDGKLICVFGCGGNRDVTKRPKMAKIAEDLADVVVITSDNPRNEDPNIIVEDMLKGLTNIEDVIVEIDRKKAINMLKNIANINDVILLAGKGHETYQVIKNEKIYFDDKEEAKKVFLS